LFLSRAVHAGRDDTGVYHEAMLPVKRWLQMAVVCDTITGAAVVGRDGRFSDRFGDEERELEMCFEVRLLLV